ncbi:MAG: Gfo/Idh/MocA family protein [Armatimonadota bacterium]
MTRRAFLTRTAALAAAPYVITSSALGQEERAAPSERITLGGIGIGGRGSGDLRWMMRQPDVQCVAVCDVRRDRRERAKAMVDERYGNTDCAAYRDLRDLLARDDIDAVLIAISDRWHTLASVMAMKAGKDVYCEKPCAVSIEESRVLADTARTYGRVFQAGTQRRSAARFVFTVLLARSGKLGKLHKLVAHIWGRLFAPHIWLEPQPEPPKDEVDWDLWLGPVPWRPYNRGHVDNRMGDSDLWAGGLHEWGAHTFDLCQWANESDHTSPVEYEFPDNDTGEGLVARYVNGVELVTTAGHFKGSCGVRFEGEEGWAQCSDGQKPEAEPASLLDEQQKLLDEYVEQTGRSLDHVRDFCDCVKSRRPAAANAEVARRAHAICHVGAICMQLKRDVRWDPAKEEFVGDEEANRMRSRAQRAPWLL